VTSLGRAVDIGGVRRPECLRGRQADQVARSSVGNEGRAEPILQGVSGRDGGV